MMTNTEQQALGLVLVVDDDDGVRLVLSRWLAEMGNSVRSAADAESALDIMREHQVDVAFVTFGCPDATASG